MVNLYGKWGKHNHTLSVFELMINCWFGAWWFGIRIGIPLSNNPFHCRGPQGYPQKSNSISSEPRCSKLSGLSSGNSVARGGLHGSVVGDAATPQKGGDLEGSMTWPWYTNTPPVAPFTSFTFQVVYLFFCVATVSYVSLGWTHPSSSKRCGMNQH